MSLIAAFLAVRIFGIAVALVVGLPLLVILHSLLKPHVQRRVAAGSGRFKAWRDTLSSTARLFAHAFAEAVAEERQAKAGAKARR